MEGAFLLLDEEHRSSNQRFQWMDPSVGQILSEECIKLLLFCRGDGQRLLWRRCLQSLCSTLEWHSWAGRLIGPEPLLQVSARGLTWRRCAPPILEGEGSCKQCT